MLLNFLLKLSNLKSDLTLSWVVLAQLSTARSWLSNKKSKGKLQKWNITRTNPTLLVQILYITCSLTNHSSKSKCKSTFLNCSFCLHQILQPSEKERKNDRIRELMLQLGKSLSLSYVQPRCKGL